MSALRPQSPGRAASLRASRLLPGTGGRVLMLSMRRVSDLVAYCIPYELEDVFRGMTDADLVEVDGAAGIEFSRRTYKALRLGLRARGLAESLYVRPSQVRLDRDYDLFFPVFNDPFELFALNVVADWRKRTRLAACYLSEVWLNLLPGYLLEQLAAFDHVFVGSSEATARAVGKATGRPTSFVPLAADVLSFAPATPDAPRPIDVANIGRRSAVTHGALVHLARQRRLFYYFDTVAATGADQRQRTFRVANAAEHRLQLSSLLQRTRFFVANRARANEPEYQEEDQTSARFYEGAAAGCVMIGLAPRSRQFHEEFDWTDAVIRVPFDSPDIGEVLADLDRDPERLRRIHHRNLMHGARRHDWANRITAIYAALELPPPPGLLARQQALEAIAALAEAGLGEPPAQRDQKMLSLM